MKRASGPVRSKLGYPRSAAPVTAAWRWPVRPLCAPQVDLGRNEVQVGGAAALGAALVGNGGCSRLLLGHNGVGAEGARALVRGLSTSGVRVLDLSANGLQDDGAAAVADLLRPARKGWRAATRLQCTSPR